MSEHVDVVQDAVDDAVELRVGVGDRDVEQRGSRASHVDEQERRPFTGGVVAGHVPRQLQLDQVRGVPVDGPAQP